MMTNPDLTALLSAFGRAWHAENDPDPLFTDPCQRRLLTENEFRFMEQYLTIGAADAGTDLRGMMHGLILPPLLSRARLCEDAFRAALRDGTEQFLLLASGLDTAALRWCRETPCRPVRADQRRLVPAVRRGKRRVPPFRSAEGSVSARYGAGRGRAHAVRLFTGNGGEGARGARIHGRKLFPAGSDPKPVLFLPAGRDRRL